MSLINDALKRAKEAQQQNAPAAVPLFRPVEPRMEIRRVERKGSPVVPIVVAVLIAGALVFVGLVMLKHKTSFSDNTIAAAPETPAPANAAPAPQPVAAAPAPAPNPPAAPTSAPNPPVAVVAAAAPAPNLPAPVIPVATSAPVAAPASVVPAAPVVEVPSPVVVPMEPLPPTLVQGIAFDSAHPWAIINGRTVNVGDYVSGEMRVVDISHNSVTLVGHGRTNNLVVGQQ